MRLKEKERDDNFFQKLRKEDFQGVCTTQKYLK